MICNLKLQYIEPLSEMNLHIFALRGMYDTIMRHVNRVMKLSVIGRILFKENILMVQRPNVWANLWFTVQKVPPTAEHVVILGACYNTDVST